MHDALRQRLLRRIESLPDAQVYQVLDFIEFLESKYAGTEPVEASGLQKFAESLEDKLRKKAVSPATIREAFQLISAADRVLHGVSSAGKQILSDLNQALETPEEGAPGVQVDRTGGAPAAPRREGGPEERTRGGSGRTGGNAPGRGGASSGSGTAGRRPATGGEGRAGSGEPGGAGKGPAGGK